jgi:cell division protease FtsH
MKSFFKKNKIWILFAIVAIFGLSYDIAYSNHPTTPQPKSVSITTPQQLSAQAEAIAGLGDSLESSATEINSYNNNSYSKANSGTSTGRDSVLDVKVVSSNKFLDLINSNPVYINHKHLIATTFVQAKSYTQKSIIYAARYLSSQENSIAEAANSKKIDVFVVNESTYYNNGVYSGYSSYSGTINTIQPVKTSSGTDWFMVIFLIFIIALFFRLIKSSWNKNGFNKAGNVSTVKSTVESDGVPQVTFEDVAGCDEAIEDMRELVDFLKYPDRYAKVKAKPPKGALLVGPPGTGKTLLARAVAGEANVPFYPVAGSDFVEMYVGVGAKRVRDLFKKAKTHPEGAIVFIDEIDAVGRQRGAAGANSNTETENTLNSLLVELDGFEKTKVIVIAATNRDDILDKALMRPGRLDRKIHVPLPDRAGRERILEVHSFDKPLAGTIDLTMVARRTPGMSGADLSQLVNEAAMNAARDNREVISNLDFDNAIATVTMGKERKSAIISEEDKTLTAWHEAGHALCGLLQEDAVHPVSISIVPRGYAGGVTHFPSRDSGYITRKQAYSQLVTAMGGMAAEQMFIGEGEFTTGPSSDLQQGTNLALAMITQYGMGESLLVKSEGILSVSNQASNEALEEADALLRKALEDAKFLLSSHSELVSAFVESLLEYETLSNEQIKNIMQGYKVKATSTPPPAPRKDARIIDKNKGFADNVMANPAEVKIPQLLVQIVKVVNSKISRNKRKQSGL